MSRRIPALTLNSAEQEQIRQWLNAHGTPQQVALRCRIILAAAAGHAESAVATQWGTNRKTVRLLADALRPTRPGGAVGDRCGTGAQADLWTGED
jgi:hypothetical protein